MKDKESIEPQNPLQIDKSMVDTMPQIPKGVYKRETHNPNVWVSPNYLVVEDLSQTPCDMSALEMLQIFPLQCNALLDAIGSLDSTDLVAKFNLFDAKPCLHYHIAFQIEIVHVAKTIG